MIPYIKMQNVGNSFLIIDETEEILVPEEEKELFTKKICSKSKGIGADSTIFLSKAKIGGDIKFSIFDREGPENSTCGNGLLCTTKLKGLKGTPFFIETNQGLRKGETKGNKVSIDMGKAEIVADEGIEVDLGIHHRIYFVEDLEKINPLYKAEDNINFVKVENKNQIRIKTYEDNVGFTKGCGSGAGASALASYIYYNLNSVLNVVSEGGIIKVTIDKDLNITIEGSPKIISSGVYLL